MSIDPNVRKIAINQVSPPIYGLGRIFYAEAKSQCTAIALRAIPQATVDEQAKSFQKCLSKQMDFFNAMADAP